MKQPHDNWASYFDYAYERTFGNGYGQFTRTTIQAVKGIIDKGTIFDFGAGTGRLTIPLKQEGYEVTAIEKSQPMDKIIQEKAQTLNLTIPICVCDIADFDNKGKADMALALFTVLSYATSEKQIEAIISNIKNHLLANAYFFFDLPKPIFFQRPNLLDINQSDFKRQITLTPTENEDIYEYSETCSGKINGNDFNYKDSFQIRDWKEKHIDELLIKQGFRNTNNNFAQFAHTGSTYKLYQVNENSTKA